MQTERDKVNNEILRRARAEQRGIEQKTQRTRWAWVPVIGLCVVALIWLASLGGQASTPDVIKTLPSARSTLCSGASEAELDGIVQRAAAFVNRRGGQTTAEEVRNQMRIGLLNSPGIDCAEAAAAIATLMVAGG